MSRISNSNSTATSSKKKTVAKELVLLMHCPVCLSAGKSKEEYTSHFVRETPSPQSAVTCPLILNNECSYCREIGHFPSTCSSLANLKREKKNDEKEDRRIQFDLSKNIAKTNSAVQSKSIFAAAFGSDSDSDSDETPKKKRIPKKVSIDISNNIIHQDKKAKTSVSSVIAVAENTAKLTQSNFPTMMTEPFKKAVPNLPSIENWAKIAARPAREVAAPIAKKSSPTDTFLATISNNELKITDSWDMDMVVFNAEVAKEKVIQNFSAMTRAKKYANWADASDSDSDSD